MLRRRDSDASFGCAGTDDEALYVAPAAPEPKESYMKKYAHNPFTNRRPQAQQPSDNAMPAATASPQKTTSFESSGRPSSNQSNSSWATSSVTGPTTPTEGVYHHHHHATKPYSLRPDLREQEARIDAYAKAKWSKEMENDSLFNFDMNSDDDDDDEDRRNGSPTVYGNAGARSSKEAFTGRTSPSAAYYTSTAYAPAASASSLSSSNPTSFYGPSSPSQQQQQQQWGAQNLARGYQAEIGGGRSSSSRTETGSRRPSFVDGAYRAAVPASPDHRRPITGYGPEYWGGYGREV
ncbi:hypothetical protein LTS18_007323 [Coniosporium uncinatum]|uniref:Uncharacterized protein n=1 Tax=Coniosporium uncinatum TaxID=93489 RepID=A0ACC3D2M5_9PEZI|nr:hypothetical protein LTS18_007323 [Coniosporium uncinatum]